MVNLPKPLNDYVLIERPKAPRFTDGGLAIPIYSQRKQTKGKVLAVGPGRRLKDGTKLKINVNVGDMVLFRRHGVETKIFWPPGARRHQSTTRELIFVKDVDLLGVVEG